MTDQEKPSTLTGGQDASKRPYPTESDDVSRLREENTELRLQRENAQLRIEIRQLGKPAPPTRPWWKSPAIITTLTAVLAAVLPATTAVQGWFQNRRELALQELKIGSANKSELQKLTNAIEMQREKQTDEIRTAYLERLKTPSEHLRVLRYVLTTTGDQRLRDWAVEERKLVELELKRLESETQRMQAELAEKHREQADAPRPREMRPPRDQERMLGKLHAARSTTQIQSTPTLAPTNFRERWGVIDEIYETNSKREPAGFPAGRGGGEPIKPEK
jgi:hypothetical protein